MDLDNLPEHLSTIDGKQWMVLNKTLSALIYLPIPLATKAYDVHVRPLLLTGGILYEYVVYLDKYFFGTPAAPWEKLKIGGGLAYDFSMIYVTFAIYTP